MIAEAAEARLVRQAIHEEADIILSRLAGRCCTEVKPLTAAALLAAHINEHGKNREARGVTSDACVPTKDQRSLVGFLRLALLWLPCPGWRRRCSRRRGGHRLCKDRVLSDVIQQ